MDTDGSKEKSTRETVGRHEKREEGSGRPLHDLTRSGDLAALDTDEAIVESLSKPFDDVGVLDQDVELGHG